MKLLKLNGTKNFAYIGDDASNAQWYVIEANVKKFMEAIPFGTEVTIKSDQRADKKQHLTFIQVVKGGEPSTHTEPEPETTEKPQPTLNVTHKTSDKSAAISQMVCGALIALQGHVTPDSVKGVMTDLYNHAKNLVG